MDIPKQAKKVQVIKLWKESQSSTTVTRRGRQSFPRHLNNAQSRDPDADDPEVNNQNTHNASNNDNNGDLHAAIVSLTATVQSLSEKVSSLEERDKRTLTHSQEGRSLSTTDIPDNIMIPDTSSSTDASNPSAAVGLLHAAGTHQGTNARCTVIPNSDRTTQDYTIGGSMKNFRRQACNISKSTFGYAAESLPFVETISPQMRKNIIEGKDVNLCALLIPYYSGPMINDERIDTYYCSNRKPDPRLNKTLSLSEFIQAFGTYKSVMSEAYPDRRIELDLYERDIVDMSNRYPGSGFYEYHKQFSATAAAYLKTTIQS